MILLIDAYNVIKMALGKPQIRDDERNTFIKNLGNYAKNRKLTVIAVFDGGPLGWFNKASSYGITVIYSGAKQSADDYIKDYLEQNKGKDILLVSSDRELGAWASQLELPSLGALEFYSLMRLAIQPDSQEKSHSAQLVKMSEEEHPELDLLMEQEIVPDKAEEPTGARTKGQGKKLSKVERQLLEKIKKL